MPRYNIYLESETEGELVVNAGISKWYGLPWPKTNTPDEAPPVVFSINLVYNNDVLVSNNVSVGTTGNVFSFNFTNIKPSFDPYKVVLFGATPFGHRRERILLPARENGRQCHQARQSEWRLHVSQLQDKPQI